MPEPSDDYQASFGIEPSNAAKVTKALDIALDTRKFEIGLYWQRAAYFWALIAAAFAGYLAVLSVERMSDNAFVVACVGFVFSVAWFRVNRGSKFWQENWENHVDMLEDHVSGPLFKTILCRNYSTNKPFSERWIYGPSAVSVSKVNHWISLFTIIVWMILAVSVLDPVNSTVSVNLKNLAVLAATLLFTYLIFTRTGTHLGDHLHRRIVKRSIITESEVEPPSAG